MNAFQAKAVAAAFRGGESGGVAHHRLFVAIRPPRAIRETLLGLMGGIPGARWQDDAQLHLTLRFIGEVDRHQANDVVAALGGFSHPAVEVALAGVGEFGKANGRAIWAGVGPREPLERLHNKADQALRAAAVEPERRAFTPHITLARLGRSAGPVAPFLARHAGLAGPPFRVTEIALFESTLGRGGSAYTIVERFALR